MNKKELKQIIEEIRKRIYSKSYSSVSYNLDIQPKFEEEIVSLSDIDRILDKFLKDEVTE